MEAPALTHTMSFDPTDCTIPKREEHVLKACRDGNIDALKMVFQACNITAPATPITVHNADTHILPHTHRMVEAAVRGHQKQTVEYLYSIFPDTRIHGDELVAAIEIGNLQIFEIIARQSQSRYDVIHREFPDEETTLIKSCRGVHPSIAFYLLDEGADPNYSGSSGELGIIASPLANAVAEQDIELVEKLVTKGAVVEDWHIHVAVEKNRPHIVRYLANTKEELDFQTHLEEASVLGHKEVINVLERRISNGIETGPEKKHHFADKWHHMTDHLVEKIHIH